MDDLSVGNGTIGGNFNPVAEKCVFPSVFRHAGKNQNTNQLFFLLSRQTRMGTTMLKHFLPREHCFYNHFDDHISLAVAACREFLAIANGGDIQSGVKKITQIENDTDKITHQCIEALHKTFITPMERTDIQKLIQRLDDIVDFVDSAATRLVLYDVKKMRSETKELADVLIAATLEIEKALKKLRDSKHLDSIRDNMIVIYNLENRGDEILRSALMRLFKEKDPILIIKWKEIFERLEKAVDRCEDVANIIEGVVISAS
jgi:uncharacterized protein